MRGARIAAALLFAWPLGCGSTTIPEGRYSCAPGVAGDCPAGWFCRADGLCWSTPGDGGTDAEADGDVDVVEDGVVEGTDDGDTGDDGDVEAGCDPATCDDGNACNGEEVCTVDGRCVPTLPPDDGTACTTPCGEGQCFFAQCRPLTCGNGVVEECEDCDDGNFLAGDGCEPDCTFTCELNADCADGELCNGDEACLGHLCEPGTPAPNGTPCGEGLRCGGGVCASPRCPDGVVDPGEECDDGNFVDDDGCDNDCHASCLGSAECDDLLLCNGVETCDTERHLCRPGVPAADGTPCTTAEGGEGACRGEVCAGLGCGNGAVETGEECDDGNTTAGDGCEPDCAWTCETDPECDDGLVCDGAETCELGGHVCAAGAAAADGTACELDGDPGTRDVCLAGGCRASSCPDGYADELAGEECDDGNTLAGDGCEPDCRWSCEAGADCDDLDACSGVETCDLGAHRCLPGTPLADDTACTTAGGTTGRCRSGACTRLTCGDGTVQAGEECDDGNAVDGDGCDSTCVYSCHGAADCHEAPDLACTTDTCESGGTGQLCRHAPNTEPCDDGSACTAGDACDGAGTCVGTALDGDGDTYGPGAECGGDCDDAAAALHPGATEACNGLDEDCSGAADDGPGMTCAEGSSRACVATGPSGSCAGLEECTAGTCRWSGVCELSAVETCNGTDDDCDGATDEGFGCVMGTSEPCTTSCGLAAVRVCEAGCVPGACATAEVACNACDDDADGRTDEGMWCPVTGLPTTQDLYAVWGAAADDVWVVGNAGTMLHWNGSAWASVSGGGTRVLRGAYAASAGAAWAVGDAAAILAWDGTAWAPESAGGATANLRDVWGASAGDVWAVGDGGRILRRTGGTWAAATSGTPQDLGGVWGSGGSDVWACAAHKAYTRWNGTAWASGSLNDGSFDAYAIGGSSPTDVWAAGSGGGLRHWAGAGWVSVTSGTTAALRGVYVPSLSDAWLVGDGGTIRRWNGTAWAAATSGTTRALYGVWGASASEVWVVGAGGTILRGRW